jgi:hypothetical protein
MSCSLSAFWSRFATPSANAAEIGVVADCSVSVATGTAGDGGEGDEVPPADDDEAEEAMDHDSRVQQSFENEVEVLSDLPVQHGVRKLRL